MRRRSECATPNRQDLDFARVVDRLLSQSSLQLLACRTLGFGPLSFLGRPVMSESRSIRVNARLQSLADGGTPA